jgi:hypothetical protein
MRSALARSTDPLVAMQAQIDRLEARLAVFEQQATRQGPRDMADALLLEALAAIVLDATFHAVDVIERGRLDPAFRERLLAADVETASELGYLLRRARGHRIGGRRLDGLGRNDNGIIWRFTDDDDPSSGAAT